MAQRRHAAESAVAPLHGRRIQLVGYLVSASVDGRGVADHLLVPWAGACSHTPPPPMNQVVRVPADLGAPPHDRPVTLTGTIEVRPAEQQLFLRDGMVSVRSAYALQGAALVVVPTRDASSLGR
jgi:hypothetical protein